MSRELNLSSCRSPTIPVLPGRSLPKEDMLLSGIEKLSDQLRKSSVAESPHVQFEREILLRKDPEIARKLAAAVGYRHLVE